ncbi:hypothetical protein MTO96_024035 [Rhipicephalus appendiculatus]
MMATTGQHKNTAQHQLVDLFESSSHARSRSSRRPSRRVHRIRTPNFHDAWRRETVHARALAREAKLCRRVRQRLHKSGSEGDSVRAKKNHHKSQTVYRNTMASSKANGATGKYQNVKGRIYSVHRVYGFIEVEISLKDNVYFNHDTFEDGRYADLLTSGLKAGDLVIVDFIQRPGTELYRALSVRRVGYVPQPQKRAEDKIPSFFDNEEGVVCVLRDSHAFVRISRFRGVTASFQKSDLEAYMGRPVATLKDVLELGVKLRFDAMCNPDDRSKTKWMVEKLRSVEGIPPAAPGRALTPRDSKPNSPAATGTLVGRRGRVQEVFQDHAVVRYGARPSDTAYMHASVVEKSLEVDIEDLRDVLEEGGKVRFDADSNGFQYGRGKWHVTRVELQGSSSRASLYSAPSSAVSIEALTMSKLFADGFSGEADDLHELCLEPRSRLCSNQEEEGCDVRSGRTDVTSTRSRRNVADERRRSPYLFNGGDDDEFPALPSRAQEKEGSPSVSIYENVPAVRGENHGEHCGLLRQAVGCDEDSAVRSWLLLQGRRSRAWKPRPYARRRGPVNAGLHGGNPARR